MPKLAMHPVTEAAVAGYISKPAHALLLTGPTGSGKPTIARHLVTSILGITDDRYADHPYIRHVTPVDGKAISIEAIRSVQQFVALKVPASNTDSGSNIARSIVIEDAHLMTTEAQNALLKTLEEPPLDTIVILTASSPEALLPTIRSRAQSLNLVTPSLEALQAYFKLQGHDSKQIDQALMVSGGLPGLTHSMLSAENHPLMTAIEQARKLLQVQAYERLALVDKLSKQRELVLDTLYILGQMARTALLRNPTMPLKSRERWELILKNSYQADESLRQNAQTKLVLTSFMLSI